MLISVIIPTKDRAQKLIRCLDSLEEQRLDKKNFEVIVVFNGNYDTLRFERYKRRLDIKFIEFNKVGAGLARNHGAALAKGEYLAFIDDDCTASQDWLSKINQYIKSKDKKKFAAVGGSVYPLNKNGSVIHRYLSYIEHLNGPIKDNGQIINLSSANLTIRKDIFVGIGGFDERLEVAAEDQNLISRIIKNTPVDFCKEISLFHDHDISFRDFKNKFRRYGYGVYEHYYFSKMPIAKNKIYIPYCKSLLGVIIRIPKICCDAWSLIIKPKKINLLFFPFAFIQEFYFQLGAKDAFKKYRTALK